MYCKTNITRECVIANVHQKNPNSENIYSKIIEYCELSHRYRTPKQQFIIFIKMFEQILTNWNDNFRHVGLLTELLNKLNFITRLDNLPLLEDVCSCLFEDSVNYSTAIVQYWKKIIIDELSCAKI
jgi:hypothetical protein